MDYELFLILGNHAHGSTQKFGRMERTLADLTSRPDDVWHDNSKFGSAWLVFTLHTLAEVNHAIADSVEKGDNFFVINVTAREAAGRMDGKLWQWLLAHGGRLDT